MLIDDISQVQGHEDFFFSLSPSNNRVKHLVFGYIVK